FYCFFFLLVLPSFPTRRSSDLVFPADHGADFFVYAESCAPAPRRDAARRNFAARNARLRQSEHHASLRHFDSVHPLLRAAPIAQDRKSTRLNSSHSQISYAVFC